MKIITDTHLKIVECSKCHSILEIHTQKDLGKDCFEDRGNHYCQEYYYCPCCEHRNVYKTYRIYN